MASPSATSLLPWDVSKASSTSSYATALSITPAPKAMIRPSSRRPIGIQIAAIPPRRSDEAAAAPQKNASAIDPPPGHVLYGTALCFRRLLLRREPAHVRGRERQRRHSVRVDGERDRDDPGRDDRVDVVELGTVEHEHDEDDRREPARAEPACIGNRGQPCAGSERRNGDGDHARDRQAEHAVKDDAPVDLVQDGAERRSTEDDEGHAGQRQPGCVRDVRDLGTATASDAAEDEPTDEGGDEAAAAERRGNAVRQRGGGERDDLEPVLGDETTGL